MTFDDILPFLSALLATVLTLLVNYKLGQVKNSAEMKIAQITEEKEFRDDLIQMVKDYDARTEKQDLKISDLQKALNSVREENYELKVISNEQKRKIAALEDELSHFQRKVYYRGGDTKKE